MNNYKIALIQVWLGPFPDYFKYHLKTCENQSYIDFFIFTDHNINIKLPSNVKVFKTTKTEIENKISVLINSSIKISDNKKACDLKASYGDLFKEYLTEYDYVGCYDIDTLMGDLYNWIYPYLGKYDFISSADLNFHNRLSGPFLIWKNKLDLNTVYKKSNFIDIMSLPEVYCFEEKEFSDFVISNYSTKLIYNSQNVDSFTGKVLCEAIWTGGKVYCEEKEIMFHHFYNKPYTELSFKNNSIVSKYKKTYIEDFYWVTHFTQNYEFLVKTLINSIKKFSNRKCILYTINYTSDLVHILDDQFIIRRLDVDLGKINTNGKYDNVLSLKPSILLDVINYLPNKKFIYTDTDIHLTVNADSIVKYFADLKDFPLINSHTHDRIAVANLVPGESISSPINILAEATGDHVRVTPRRKTNVIVFDKESKWFFEDQIKLFNSYKNTRPGIFALHDEDSANLLINRYNLQKCLPLVDIEEVPFIDINIFYSYKYNINPMSKNLVLPKHENDILVFHGFKNSEFEKQLKENYLKTVLVQDDFLVKFENNTFWWIKNSFLQNKNIQSIVKFEVLKHGHIIYTLNNQDIFKYWGFFIENCNINPGYYDVRIVEETTNRVIYKNIIKI